MPTNKLLKINQENKKIAICGLGVETKQFIDWLINVLNFNPTNIIVIDKNEIDAKYEYFKKIGKFVISDNFIEINKNNEIEMVIKSPGIWSLKSEFVDFRQNHGQNSVVSSLSFFIEKFKDHIIGVTGTKGKTTTSSIIKHILSDKTKVNYCGNSVGLSPYKFWNQLDQKIDGQVFVLELSSFQLHDLGNSKISPKVAICTNLYIDHQDIHHGKDEYWQAKENIYKFQDQDSSLIISQQIKNLSMFENAQNTFIIDQPTVDFYSEVLDFDTFSIKGDHNKINIIMGLFASIQIIHGGQVDCKDIILKNLSYYNELLRKFKPVEFRCQKVFSTNRNGVEIDFYNDMQGTTPESTFYAVNGLTQQKDECLILMTGSKAKTDDYSLIINTIKEKINCGKMIDLYLFDEIGKTIKENLENDIIQSIASQYPKNTRVYFEKNKLDLDEYAKRSKEKGFQKINILMSPLGSSFNEFKNYREKGEIFNSWATSHKA